MSNKIKLRISDEVVVLAGKDKGKTGSILKIIPQKNQAVVSGVNLKIMHKKQTQTDAGGKISKEFPINLSNLSFFDKELKVASKVGFKIDESGNKYRFSKKSGKKIENN
jgi:large subunit ribosomal protein L24